MKYLELTVGEVLVYNFVCHASWGSARFWGSPSV